MPGVRQSARAEIGKDGEAAARRSSHRAPKEHPCEAATASLFPASRATAVFDARTRTFFSRAPRAGPMSIHELLHAAKEGGDFGSPSRSRRQRRAVDQELRGHRSGERDLADIRKKR